MYLILQLTLPTRFNEMRGKNLFFIRSQHDELIINALKKKKKKHYETPYFNFKSYFTLSSKSVTKHGFRLHL